MSETDAHGETHVSLSPEALASLPEGPDPLINQRIGDYVVTDRLGVGGMGIVYAAIQPLIGKAVAIKVLRPEIARDPEQAQRLFFEATAIASVRHRSVIDVFNVGQLPDGRHYLVMELLNGESLTDVLARRQSLPLAEALELFDEVLAGLGAAHHAGFVHRDIKPSNIFLVTQSDGSCYVKLLDFGIAKQSITANALTPQTRNGAFLGTPEYVAPEQAKGAAIGPQTDLYSAGVVLFELLTGRLPFTAATAIEHVIQHLQATPPAVSSFAPDVPPAIDELVHRMLAKEPAHRPATAAEVRAVIAPLMRPRRPSLAPIAPATLPTTTDASPDRAFTLRLGTRFELGLSWITPALSGLRRLVPNRGLHLCFGDSPDLVRQLRNGEIDCAVTSARVRGEWICREDLHEETYTFVAAPSALSGPSATFPRSDLALADIHAERPLFRYLLEAYPNAATWKFDRVEVLGTIAAVAYRVLEGDAIAVLPTYYVKEALRSGALVSVFPEVALQRDQFRLLWRDGHPRDRDIRLLASQLREIELR